MSSTQPVHHLGNCCNGLTRRKRRPVHHDDRQTKIPRDIELPARGIATGILGDQPFCVVGTHKVEVTLIRKRAASCYEIGIGKGQRFVRHINYADQIMVLRSGCKSVELALADGKENTGGLVRQSGGGCGDVRHSVPQITLDGLPLWAFDCDQRHSGFGTGGNRIAAHFSGEWMGRVDDLADTFVTQESKQAGNASKSADANRQWLRQRVSRSAGIREDGLQSSISQGVGHAARLGRTPEKQDMRHG